MKILVSQPETLFSNILSGQVEWTSDTAQKYFCQFWILYRSLNVSEQLVLLKMFPAYVERSFDRSAKNYSIKIQTSSNLKSFPKTSISSKYFSVHVNCNGDKLFYTCGDIKCILDRPAQMCSEKIRKYF